ncbi:uncharacterized protein LY89DRAFT_788259 [Mollisia scopiformis]|uniref:Uncharacterized protein n=1 Tax=Mollisia scopiformis TaxID=149040 RepID=A0A132BBK8_MOLSC|nr:uncharacterized protein LY89DRAFT_788259 [Mollisia scopiformis]KUJ09389.1 hypothetical protein LY89DRAFT_788259 [Mollisia scopiformis]
MLLVVGRFLWVLFSIICFSGTALGQENLTEVLLSYPACSAKCSATYLPIANCAFTDLRSCMCTNYTLQYEIGACVLSTCNITDQIISSTITQNEICNGVPQPWEGGRAIRASIIIACFTFPIIGLRFITRIYITKKLWWDDWTILIATVLMLPNTAIPIYLSYHGLGLHFYDVHPADTPNLEKLFYISQIFYVLIQNIPKFSILLLYLRIFPTPRFRKMLFIAMAWQVAHTLAFLCGVAFQCVPVDSFWDPFIKKDHCIDIATLTYFGAGFSIFEDIVIMSLPVYELKGLNLSLRKRMALVFMFALGSFACVTSMIRLKFMIGFGKSIDSTWTNVDVVIWSQIETYTAVICGCLMCIRPLFIKYIPSVFSTKASQPSSSQLHSATWGARISSRIKAERTSRYGNRLDDEESIEVGKGLEAGNMERRGSQGNVIKVTTENVVQYEMKRTSERRAGSQDSDDIADELGLGSKENLNDRSVLKV